MQKTPVLAISIYLVVVFMNSYHRSVSQIKYIEELNLQKCYRSLYPEVGISHFRASSMF